MTPEWIWLVFVFAFGCCIGSFLNVVIYRTPRGKSLIHPGSACPACGKEIRFYDNIPLLSWLVLRGKCRNCKIAISPRYFIVELITGLLFIGFFAFFFLGQYRAIGPAGSTGLEQFASGHWIFYICIITLVAGLLAGSAIDLELWIIPLGLCWFITAVGIVISSVSVFVINPYIIWDYKLFPTASPMTAILAAGSMIGLFVALLAQSLGIIKPSYEGLEETIDDDDKAPNESSNEDDFNDRAEMLKELVFLSPVIIGALIGFCLVKYVGPFADWWGYFSQIPLCRGLFGSLWGYIIGCAVVWVTRILGTFAFGKEAMGLGDVHLMGAAGAIIGPLMVTIAFFIAPFFGLVWALIQMFSKKTRQIPYGPFLSMGIIAVIILHDRIMQYISTLYF